MMKCEETGTIAKGVGGNGSGQNWREKVERRKEFSRWNIDSRWSYSSLNSYPVAWSGREREQMRRRQWYDDMHIDISHDSTAQLSNTCFRMSNRMISRLVVRRTPDKQAG